MSCNKAAKKYVHEQLMSVYAPGKAFLKELAVGLVNDALGQGRDSHGSDMELRRDFTSNTWIESLGHQPNSEVAKHLNVGSPLGKIAAVAVPGVVTMQGIGDLPVAVMGPVAEAIFSDKGLFPFIAESLGVKDFHRRVQEPIYDWVYKVDNDLYDKVGIHLTKQTRSVGFGISGVQSAPVPLTLANSRMTSASIIELFKGIQQKQKASRLMVVKTDDVDQEALEQLEQHDEGVDQASSFLAQVWNAKASEDRGASIILTAFLPPNAPLGSAYREPNLGTIIPSEEMLSIVLDV